MILSNKWLLWNCGKLTREQNHTECIVLSIRGQARTLLIKVKPQPFAHCIGTQRVFVTATSPIM